MTAPTTTPCTTCGRPVLLEVDGGNGVAMSWGCARCIRKQLQAVERQLEEARAELDRCNLEDGPRKDGGS